MLNSLLLDSQVATRTSGFLRKKGGGISKLGRHSWKRRWFVLAGTRLAYFGKQTDTKTKVSVLSCHEARSACRLSPVAVAFADLSLTHTTQHASHAGSPQGIINLEGAQVRTGRHRKYEFYFEVRTCTLLPAQQQQLTLPPLPPFRLLWHHTHMAACTSLLQRPRSRCRSGW